MDVTCQRCKAEYEFDETLLGEKGTTVKCSSCGHVFRVLPPDRDAGHTQLKLRYAKDGTTQSIASLRELQQRIRAGEVGLDDELGRDGFPFRRLRDLPELKNFFARSPEKTTMRPDPAASLADATAKPKAVQTVQGHGQTLLGAPASSRPAEVDEDESLNFGEVLDAPTVVGPIPEEIRQRPAGKRDAPSEPKAEERWDEDDGDEGSDAVRMPRTPAARGRDVQEGASTGRPDAKRTMLGLGLNAGGQPKGSLPAPARTPATAAGTLGPPPAMARGREPFPARPHTQQPREPQPREPNPREPQPREPNPREPFPRPQAGREPQPQAPTAAPEGPSREAAPKLSAAGTLVGAPSRVFAAPEPDRPPASPTASTAPTVQASGLPAVSAFAGSQVGAPGARAADFSPSGPPAPAPSERAPLAGAGASFASAASSLPPTSASGGKRSVPPASPVRLYLEEDEVPRERVTASSSKIWVYLVLLALLAGGGWFGMNALTNASKATESAVQPEVAPDAAVAVNDGPPDGSLVAAPALADPSGANAADGSANPQAAAASDDVEGSDEPRRDDDGERAEKRADTADKADKEKKAESTREHGSSRSSGADPSDYGGWVARGDQLAGRNDHDGAAKAYEAALALRPTGSEANAGLGFTLLQRGRAREALPHFDRAANSGYAEANIGLGDAYRKLGQTSSALEAYKGYLERLPSGGRASYARSWIDKLEKGDAPREPAAREPAPSAPAETGYRPAGELIEQPAPTAPAPAPAPAAGESPQ